MVMPQMDLLKFLLYKFSGQFLLAVFPMEPIPSHFKPIRLKIPPLVVENVTVVQGEVTAYGEIDLNI